MGDPREKLKAYEGKRVTVRGVFAEKKDWKESYREVGRAAIKQPEIEGELVADYVWCINITTWTDIKERHGELVEFDALVSRYQDGQNRANWCLKNPSRPLWIKDGAPALAIPGVPVKIEQPKPKQLVPIKEPVMVQHSNGNGKAKPRKYTTLSGPQFYQLAEEVKNRREKIDGKMSFKEAHAELQSSLKFPLSENSIKTALEMVGVTILRKRQSTDTGFGSRKAFLAVLKAVHAMADELDRQIGFKFPDAIAGELAELAAKVGLLEA